MQEFQEQWGKFLKRYGKFFSVLIVVIALLLIFWLMLNIPPIKNDTRRQSEEIITYFWGTRTVTVEYPYYLAADGESQRLILIIEDNVKDRFQQFYNSEQADGKVLLITLDFSEGVHLIDPDGEIQPMSSDILVPLSEIDPYYSITFDIENATTLPGWLPTRKGLTQVGEGYYQRSLPVELKLEGIVFTGIYKFFNEEVASKGILIIVLGIVVKLANDYIKRIQKEEKEKKDKLEEKKEKQEDREVDLFGRSLESDPINAIKKISAEKGSFLEKIQKNVLSHYEHGDKIFSRHVINLINQRKHPEAREFSEKVDALFSKDKDLLGDDKEYLSTLQQIMNCHDDLLKSDVAVWCEFLEIVKKDKYWVQLFEYIEYIFLEIFNENEENAIQLLWNVRNKLEKNRPSGDEKDIPYAFLFLVLGHCSGIIQKIRKNVNIPEAGNLFSGIEVNDKTRSFWKKLLVDSTTMPTYEVAADWMRSIDEFGYNGNPFGSISGEFETRYEKIYTGHPAMAVAQNNRPAIILGSFGSGKSQLAAYLNYYCGHPDKQSFQGSKRIFPVLLKEIPVSNPMDAMLAEFIRQIGIYWASTPNGLGKLQPKKREVITRLLNSDPALRYMVEHELKALEKIRLQQNSGNISQSQWGSVDIFLHFISSDPKPYHIDTMYPAQQLRLMKEAIPQDFDQIFFIFDVQYLESQSRFDSFLSVLEQYVVEMSKYQIVPKILLPCDKVSGFRSYAGFESIALNWTTDQLRGILEQRDIGLQKYCVHQMDGNAALIRLADGSPRRLIDLGNELLKYAGAHYDLEEKINRDAFDHLERISWLKKLNGV